MLHEFWHNFTHNLFKPLLLFFYFGFLAPDPEGGVRVSLRDLPGPDDVSAVGHRLARGRRARRDQGVEHRSHRGIHGRRLRLELRDRHARLPTAGLADQAAPSRQGHGRRILRVGLGGDFCHLRGDSRQRGNGFRRVHAGHAGRHGDPRLPGGAVSGRAAAAQGDGRGRQHARRARLHRTGAGEVCARRRVPATLPGSTWTAKTTAESPSSWSSRWTSGSSRKSTASTRRGKKPPLLSRQLLREVFLNPGLLLLFGGITIGFISGLQGHKVTHDDDTFFIVGLPRRALPVPARNGHDGRSQVA